MSDEDAFLRAICDAPDEDTPRLAFADWLDDIGGAVNANWAELIRVQVPLARGSGAERDRLTARERVLTPDVAEAWPARVGLPGDLRYKDFVRGFPLTLSGPGERVRAARGLFAGRVPFREIHFREATDTDLIALASWPEARLLRKLNVWTESARIGERGLVALSGSEHLCNLERLQMQWVDYTDRAMTAFLDSPHLSGLVSVKMVGHNFGRLTGGVQQRVRERFGQWDVY